jgi:hypothetical protein
MRVQLLVDRRAQQSSFFILSKQKAPGKVALRWRQMSEFAELAHFVMQRNLASVGRDQAYKLRSKLQKPFPERENAITGQREKIGPARLIAGKKFIAAVAAHDRFDIATGITA